MKTKTYNFSEFMRNEHESKVKPPKASLLPLAAAPFMPVAAHAETTVKERMMNAFDPLIDLVQGLAYPVAMVVVLGGALFVMIGNSEKGFSLMQRAGLGYLLVMIAPMILDVLVDSMSGVI